MKNLYKVFITIVLVMSMSMSQCIYANPVNNAKVSACTLTANISSYNNVTCFGANNGWATVTQSGGTSPYTYNWSPSGGISATASNLSAGNYTVTVTDALSCTATASVSITQPAKLFLTISLNDTVCTGSCSGSLATVTVGGGTPVYTYVWSNGTTDNMATGLCAGGYTLTVMDGNGCTVSDSSHVVVYSAIPGFTVTPSITNATCLGTLDGAIALSCSGATAPFKYEWGNTYGDSSYNNINPGTYTVTIRDKNNACDVLTYTVGHTDTCGTISGYAFNDTNFNCTYDGGEPGIPDSYITISPGSYIVYPHLSGVYSQYLPYGTYTVVQSRYPGNPFAPCDSSQIVSIHVPSVLVNFADTTHTPVQDPMIKYLYSTAPVIGDTLKAVFQMVNNGSDTARNGTAYFVLPDSVMFLTTTPSYLLHSGDTIYWNYSNLLPGDTLNYHITCRVDTNPNLFNYYACERAVVKPVGVESNYENDGQEWCEPFMVACDPNEKSVDPAGSGANGYINLTDTVLTYVIRFQNTGTAKATNIYIVDTISSHLDIKTLNVLGSSNTYSYMVTGSRLKFIFSNINLPDSSVSREGSKGWIEYQIKQAKSNGPGDVINNTAYIYFDYNPAVITNTTVNTISLITGTQQKRASELLQVYPNPTKNILNLNLSDGGRIQNIAIYDITGRVVMKENTSTKPLSNQLAVNVSSLDEGIYLLQVVTDIGMKTARFAIVR